MTLPLAAKAAIWQLLHRITRCAALTAVAAWLAADACPCAAQAAARPARTGEVRVYGNEKVKTYVIRREIRLRTGEAYDPSEVQRARRRIEKIPGVDFSDIRVGYTPLDSSLSLTVIVTERSTFEGFPLIRRGLEDKFSFGLRVADSNFRGCSERISAFALFRGNTAFGLAWENPWLGQGPRIGLGIRGGYRQYEYVYDDLGEALDGAEIRRASGEASVFYTFDSGLRPYLAAGYEQVESDEPGATVIPDRDRFATLSLGLQYDGRSSRIFPWSGWYFDAAATEIGPGDDRFSIFDGLADLRTYLPILDRLVFAVQGRGRLRDGDTIPSYLRQHLGGGLTIRGYDFGSFHGVNSVVTGAELRVPVNFARQRTVEDLLVAVSVHLFADAGAAWERDQELVGELWHSGYGLGLQIMNAQVEGLRVDYGWHQGSNGRWHVEIGARF